jgi:hypothetical protein
MKRIGLAINCLAITIKKKIFKSSKTDISQSCEKLLLGDEEKDSIEELKLTEEFALKYNNTTRWQTL